MTPAALLLLADSRLPAGGHAHSGGLEEAVAAGRVASVADLALFLRGRLSTSGLVAAAFAAAACGAAGQPHRLADLDAEYDARTPSPALRKASRAQGRALLRAGRAMWPLPPDAASPAGAPLPPGAAFPAGAPLPPGAASPAGAPRPDARPPGAPSPAGVPLPDAPPPGAGASPGAVWPGPEGAHHAVALGVVARGAGLAPVDAAVVAAYGAITGPAGAAVRLLGLDPYAVQAVLAGLAPDCDATASRAATAAADGHLPASTAPLLDLGAERHARWEVRLFAS